MSILSVRAKNSSARPVENAAEVVTGVNASLRAAIIADDLTGACDAAAAFAAQGFVTEVGIAAEAQPSAACEVWSRSTESRDIAEEQLEQRLGDAFSSLPAGAMVFKKIDSVCRGNTFAEIAATLELHPDATAWIAPAFPAEGRTCVDGFLHVYDASGEHDLPIQQSLREHGVDTVLLRRGQAREQLSAAAKESKAGIAFLCDAVTQQDLEELVSLAPQHGGDDLWIGSAGLAHALASTSGGPRQTQQRLPSGPQAGDVLFFIGSTHAVTRAQISALRALEAGIEHAHIVDIVCGPDAAAKITSVMERYSSSPPAGLFVTGGDTAALVFAALGIEALRITGEFAPGIPYGTAIGGRCDGVTVLLKSGGFGQHNVLCEIASWFRASAKPVAKEETHCEG